VSTVWVAGAGDVAAVARLIAGFRDWLASDTPTDASIARSVPLLIADPNTEFLLGSGGGEATGVCQLRYRHSVWTERPDCWLEDLYVEDGARGRGVGRALVEAAFERARARGAKRIELDTNEDNAGALALYETLGFSVRSKVHGHLQGRDVFLGRVL
jgi:ribosomal protein S18 acetylase RimI-like enzyme